MAICSCFHKFGVLLVGVLVVRALLLPWGLYQDLWKLLFHLSYRNMDA